MNISSGFSKKCGRESIDATSDTTIIRNVLDGDVDAFEYLLEKYKEHVLLIVRKHVDYNHIEEVAHEVFIRAYQGLSSFKQSSGFKQWLSGITIRTCCDFWRKQYRRREIPMSGLSEGHQQWLEGLMAEDSEQSLHRKGGQAEAREILIWALGQLSPEDRMVVELVYWEGYTGKEAAGLLGCSIVNVRVRSYRARRKLQKILSGFGSI